MCSQQLSCHNPVCYRSAGELCQEGITQRAPNQGWKPLLSSTTHWATIPTFGLYYFKRAQSKHKECARLFHLCSAEALEAPEVGGSWAIYCRDNEKERELLEILGHGEICSNRSIVLLLTVLSFLPPMCFSTKKKKASGRLIYFLGKKRTFSNYTTLCLVSEKHEFSECAVLILLPVEDFSSVTLAYSHICAFYIHFCSQCSSLALVLITHYWFQNQSCLSQQLADCY